MPMIKKFTGLNNKLDPRDAGDGDLQTANNVVITDGGSIKCRAGRTTLASGNAHSIYALADHFFYVRDGALIRNGVSGETALVDPLVGTDHMSYLYLNGKLYFSNGTDKYIYSNDVVRTLGVDPPPADFVAIQTGGFCPAGTYLVSLTYVLDDGQETAATPTAELTIVGTGGIAVRNLAVSGNDRVVGINIYVSGANGEASPTGSGLFRQATIPNGSYGTDISLLDLAGAECTTLNLAPMPAGKFLGFYRGRMYAAVGKFLYYSQPWNYELTSLQHNFLPFEDDIRAVAYMENGIWVGTERSLMFIGGQDPQMDGGMQIKTKIDEMCLSGGVLAGRDMITSRTLGQGMIGLFVMSSGVYAVDGNGLPQNLTKDRWEPEYTDAGEPGCLDLTPKEAKYVFPVGPHVFAMNLSNAAVTRLINSHSSTGWFGGYTYVARSTAISILSGTDDDGSPIQARIFKSGLSYGTNAIKRLVGLVLHMRSTGNMSVTITGTSGTGTIVLVDNIDTMHGSRVKLPRGVHGRNLAVQLDNVDGAFFEIAEIDMDVETVVRRERQTNG